ncbi:hypothetical protein [Streptomyces sp. CA-106110]|uniref:hypothetical protein n=1 Tax=Streptomyces sp. CA-106110 TaxID=3240044 RepID=UPI003D914D03
MTAEDAMRIASLADWKVRLPPLAATELTEDGATRVEVPRRHFASVRTHPKTGATETLGVVGSD